MSTLRLEILPELSSGTGLFLRRVRARLEANTGQITALGAGISTSSEVARAKAVSEATERLILVPAVRSLVSISPLAVTGTFDSPVIDVDNQMFPRTTPRRQRASACHLDLLSAVRAATTEAAERRHLWEWSHRCELEEDLTIEKIHPGDSVSPLIADFLSLFALNILVSYVPAQSSLPAVVLLAIRPSEECFYAASAAGPQWSDSIEAALLDIAKILIVEQHLAANADALCFRRPLSELPNRFRYESASQKSVGWLPVRSEHAVSERILLLGAPWLQPLGRRMVEIPLVLGGEAPRALEWFR